MLPSKLPIGSIECALPDGPAVIAYLPGVTACHAGHRALFDAVRRIPPGRIFIAGPGATTTALWAARAGAHVVHWTDNVAETLSLQATFEHAGLPAPQSTCAVDFSSLQPGTYELALLHLPRGRFQQRELLQAAGALIKPGGKIYFVGAKREGIRSALKTARTLFGRAAILVRKGSYHVGVITRTADTDSLSLPIVRFQTHHITLDRRPTELVSCEGVFAHDHLDGGTEALITAMRITPGTTVLDLGCGTGLAALAAFRRGAHVLGTDVSARAIASAQRTLAANGNPDAALHLCIGAAAIASNAVDTVITNPPFHRGYEVNFEISQLFVREAARVLRPGGDLFLVANAFLDYSRWLQGTLTSVTIVHDTGRFCVWHGHKSG